MSSYTSFIQAALLAAQQDNSSLTAPIHTFTGHEPKSCHGVETLNKVSTRPVQIAQGEERQAIQYSTPVEGRGEFKESTEETTEFKEFTEKTAEFKESAKTTELTVSTEIEEDFAIKVKEDFKERAQNAQSNSEDAKKAQEDEAQAEAQAKAPKRSDESNEELKEHSKV